jgi:paraquat-inducible protein B
MTRAATEKTEGSRRLPKPRIRKMRWPYLIWLFPILAACLTGYYAYDHVANRGPLIAITFPEVSGLKVGQSEVMHLGVTIGEVVDLQLTDDQKTAVVHVRLNRADDAFARQGAVFWIVRPQISMEEISGLTTMLSGPYIEAAPGGGDVQTQFTGLPNPPIVTEPGLRLVLNVSRSDRVAANAPIYYRGIQVGEIESVELSPDAAGVDVHVFIRRRFSPLVRTNSQWWLVSGLDVQGGLLSGVQMKMQSLKSLIAGGLEFATPDKGIGPPAQSGARFILNDQVNNDWLNWRPMIPIGPEDDPAVNPQNTNDSGGQAIKDLAGAH